MAYTKSQREANRLLNLPPVKWDNAVSGLDGYEGQALSQQLDAIAERAARLSAYINERTYNRNDHQTAVERQNKIAYKVRKALGFSYPEDNLWF